MPKRWVAFILIAVAAILWMVGATELVAAGRPRQSVEGTVVSSSVDERRFPLAGDVTDRTRYVPVVVYEYEVRGGTYRSDVMWAGIAPDEDSHDAESAQGVAADYPVGRHVTVWYDPTRPEDAVLFVAAAPGWILIGLGGALFAWVVVYTLWNRRTLDQKG